MKVDKEQVYQNREHLRKLIRSQRNEIAAKEGEIQKVREYYDTKVQNENIANEKRLIDVQDRNKLQLVEASADQEGKLNEIKKNLIDTQEHLQRQRENLKSQNQAQIENINHDHSLKASDLFDRSRTEMMDLNNNVNDQIKKTKLDTEQAISAIEHKSRLEVDKASFESGMKASLAQNEQARSMSEMETRYKLKMRQEEALHKDRVAEEQFKNDIEFKNRKRIQSDRHDAMEKHYQEILIGEKKAFEQKYAAAVKQHQEVLKDLDKKLKTQMLDKVQANSEKKEFIEFKAEDPFYNLQTLESRVREDDKHYYLDIPTPEHEKDNYIVTAHKRKIKIRFSRSSEERYDGEMGDVQQSRRSESLTKEFNVEKILDDKKVKTAYNDGVLTFKLAKA